MATVTAQFLPQLAGGGGPPRDSAGVEGLGAYSASPSTIAAQWSPSPSKLGEDFTESPA